MVALTSVPDGELWRSFPESTRDDIVRLLGVLLERRAVSAGLAKKLGIDKKLYAVENTRGGISKKSMIHNGATPKIEVNPETYEVRADGELLTCAPAEVLPMAQRYFMF